MDLYWLVVYLPPWKIWVRQIGSSSQLLGKIKFMFQSTNQYMVKCDDIEVKTRHFGSAIVCVTPIEFSRRNNFYHHAKSFLIAVVNRQKHCHNGSRAVTWKTDRHLPLTVKSIKISQHHLPCCLLGWWLHMLEASCSTTYLWALKNLRLLAWI